MQNVKLLSFDVFDTLVTRCVSTPVEVFSCVENRARRLGIGCVGGFRQRRIEAERRAIEKYGSESLTLNQIYSCMNLSKADKELLRAIEIEAEVELSIPISRGVQLYNSALELGVPVVLISDMYLSASSIERILEHCGIIGYDRLYVSSEYGECKASGRLFTRVLRDYAVSPSNLHHYGDSISSDYLVPRRIGARSTLVRSGSECTKWRAELDGISKRILPPSAFSFRRVTDICCNSCFERAGFGSLGPFLLAFTRWLHAKKAELNLDVLVFLSRDGYLMRQAYETVYPDEETRYVLASRRAWTVPLFCKDPGVRAVLKQMGLGRRVGLAELLSRFGFTESESKAIIDRSPYSEHELLTVASLETDARFQAFYRGIRNQIASNSAREREACLAYVSSNIPQGKIGIVDIGWRGSMQHALESLLDGCGKKYNIVGLYAGIDRSSEWAGKQTMYGFLFDCNSDPVFQDRESLYNALFEAMFIAPHGSLNHYEMKDGSVIPIFEQPEAGIGDGTCPLFELQRGAIKYVQMVTNNHLELYLDDKLPEPVTSLEQLGLHPTMNEARQIGNIEFAYQEYEPLARPRKLGHYLTHPMDLMKDFLRCYWKPAFLCRLTHVRLDYTRILLALKHGVFGRIK